MKKIFSAILVIITLTINDNYSQTIINNNFELNTTGWIIESLGGTPVANRFSRNTPAGHSTGGFTVPALTGSTNCVAYNDTRAGAVTTTDDYFRTPFMDLSIYDSVTVMFDYFSVNQISGSNVSSLLFVNTTNDITDFLNTNYYSLPSQATWRSVYITLPNSMLSTTTSIGFNFYDLSAANLGGLAVDNVLIVGHRQSTNDNCAGAVNLTPNTTCVPYSGDLSGNTSSGLPATCGGNPSNDVWFQFTATSQQALISAQATFLYDLDLVMEVYSGTCGSLTSIGCIDQDDITQTGATGIEEFLYGNYTVGQTYYVRLYNYSGNALLGGYNICIQNIPSCTLSVNPNDITEPETCGASVNSTCATGTAITCGQSYRGTISAASGSRDLDYYSFTVAQNTTATITLESEFFGYAILYNAANCANPVFIDGNYASGCTPLVITQTLAPGNYSILVAPNTFYGFACSQTNINYRISLDLGTSTAPTITAGGSTAICPTGSVVLTTSATGTYQWYESGTAISGATSSSYTATAAGSYTVRVTNPNGCASVPSNIIAVTISTPAAPTVAAGGPVTFCQGGSVVLTATGSGTSFQWYNGTTAITGATSSTYTATTAGSYTVEEVISGCTSARSTATVVAITPADDATFTYANTTICSGSANITPTVTTAGGTFSATPAGLTFVSTTTGEIDIANSSDNTYTITYTTAGTCPNSSTSTFTITSAPDASFTYANPEYCSNASDPAPVFTVGSAGTFSSTTGLIINTTTGVIDLSASTAGVYTVTNTIAASGSCPAASATTNIEVLEVPTATISGSGSLCGGTAPSASVVLTGSGPWDIAINDGTTTNTVAGITTSPYTFVPSVIGTYTITNVTDGTCSSTGTGSVVITAGTGYTSTNNQTICPGGSYTINGNTYTLAGSYNDTFTAQDGCDSTVTTNLSITNINVGVTKNGFSLTSDMTGASYQWVDCASNTDIAGATSQTFNPTVDGDYKVKVTVAGCSEESACTEVKGISINEAFMTNVNVFPNPSSDYVVVDAGSFTIDRVSLVNIEGKILSSTNVNAVNATINLSNVSDGLYFLYIYSADNMVIKKLIKK